jgi:succinate-semialdehyde dehydrogenase/glutarate-semialdehyde dehydrogenase
MTTQALQDSELFQTGYLVDGVWKSLDTTFDVLNPATGEVIVKVAKAGKKRLKPLSPQPQGLFPPGVRKPQKSVPPSSTAGTN